MGYKYKIVIISVLFAWVLIGAADSDSHKEENLNPLAGISLDKMTFDGDTYSQTTDDGRQITFTVIPELQQFADNLLKKYQVPAGAAVVLNSKTGRVLAFSQQYGKAFAAQDENVALDASPPAASVFKIVTTAALLEQSDVTLNTSTCYHGGGGGLYNEHLTDSQKLDTACTTLSSALGRSTNAVFAKLSDRFLSRNIIGDYAQKFGFNRDIPFDVPVPQSKMDVPQNRLERARASAGFWHSHISPLHGAMIAQSIAQKGAMLKPYMVDRIVDNTGNIIYKGKPQFIGRTVEKETASQLITAMTNTVTKGTARKSFKDPKGIPIVPKPITVAGKTGTLHGQKPYRAYSWFVGLAPADKPEVAIAVLVVNEPKWRIKSAWTAAQILKKYFEIKTP